MTRKPQKKSASTKLFKNAEWQTCYQQFLASIPSSITRNQYNNTLYRFFAFIEATTGGRKTPDRVSRNDIEAFLSLPSARGRRKDTPMAASSRNCYIIIFKSFYNWCASYIVEFRGKPSPILRGEIPTTGIRFAKKEKADRDMEESDVSAFFSAIDKNTVLGLRDDAIFKALLISGRRRSEITRLLRGDFEQVALMERGRIRQGWIYHFKGKGRLTKDDCAEMPLAVMDAIKRYHQAAGRDFDTLDPDHPVFTGGTNNLSTRHPLNVNVVDNRFRRYAKKAGLPENLVVHSFRRESAWQRYQENGHDILDVRDALRHEDVQTTMLYIDRRRKKHQGDPVATTLAAKYSNL